MRRIRRRSRIIAGVSYVVSPDGDIFKVVTFDRKRNKIGMIPLDLAESDSEIPVIASNRFSALVSAGYYYTNSAKEKVRLGESV